MRRTLSVVALLVWIALLWAPAAAAEEDENPALSELVEVLRAQGVLNQEDYSRLAAKAAEQEAQQAQAQKWYDRVRVWGDLRGRYEHFNFYKDTVNGQFGLKDRHRFRYRLRLNLSGVVNDYAEVFVRLATGSDSTTTNETLGSPADFAPDGIFVQEAYARLSPFKQGLMSDGKSTLHLVFGRTPQPWRWDGVHKDLLLWDDELSPEGAYIHMWKHVSDEVEVFGSTGAYAIDENSGDQDPSLFHAQLGAHVHPADAFEVGLRGTWFYFWNLDAPFLDRGVQRVPNVAPITAPPAPSAGNTLGGLTDGSRLNVIEFGGYVKMRLIEGWPIRFYGDFARNLDAASGRNDGLIPIGPGAFRTGKDGTAWLVGGDLGDAKELFRLRMMYVVLEANAFPSQFIDSDIFDGLTNREGFYWNATKQVWTNTDLTLTAFLSEEIRSGAGYFNSLSGSDRFRLQADVVWKF